MVGPDELGDLEATKIFLFLSRRFFCSFYISIDIGFSIWVSKLFQLLPLVFVARGVRLQHFGLGNELHNQSHI